MPTQLYRFHSTDGREFVIDPTGKRPPNYALVDAKARRAARKVMLTKLVELAG